MEMHMCAVIRLLARSVFQLLHTHSAFAFLHTCCAETSSNGVGGLKVVRKGRLPIQDEGTTKAYHYTRKPQMNVHTR